MKVVVDWCDADVLTASVDPKAHGVVLEVPEETYERWKRVEQEHALQQLEMSALVSAHNDRVQQSGGEGR